MASASPRRQKFFSDLGIPFIAIPVDGEPAPRKEEAGACYAARAASTKLRQCRKKLEDAATCLILAADTCVVLNGQIMGKPADQMDAYRMLTALKGKTCTVFSAACISFPKNKPAEIATVESARVKFNQWPDEIIKAYIKTGEPLDKAGAFAIQGIGSFLIDFIDGNFTTVIGLPGSWIIRKMLEYDVIFPCV